MEKVTFKEVESSNLSAVGYDEGKEELYVKFKTGAIYKYSPVSKQDYDEFMNAKSKGAFFAKHIRGNPGMNWSQIRAKD